MHKPIVELYCDYEAHGIFVDGLCVYGTDIGLNEHLAARLDNWNRVFSTAKGGPGDWHSEYWPERIGQWHNHEGEKLFRLVRAEIGDNRIITLFQHH